MNIISYKTLILRYKHSYYLKQQGVCMEKRIVSLDVIRGISLLGILFMNAL